MKKLFLLFMVCLLAGCTHDDIFQKESLDRASQEENIIYSFNQQQVDSYYKNFNPELLKSIHKDIGNVQGKSTYANAIEPSGKDYEINLEQIYVFETEKFQSVTYIINTADTKNLYNLVYFSNNKKDYYTTIIKYNLEGTSLEEAQLNTKPERITYIPIEQDLPTTLNKVAQSKSFEIDIGCATLKVKPGKLCNGRNPDGTPANHDVDDACGMTGAGAAQPNVIEWDFSGCDLGQPGGAGPSTPGNGAPGGTPGGTPGGGPGGGGFNPPKEASPIKFFPVEGIEFLDIVINFPTQKNCEQLKKWAAQNKPGLGILYNKRNDSKEHGYAYQKKTVNGATGFVQDPTAMTTVNGNTDRLNINNYIGGNYVGISHTHTNPNVKDASGATAEPIFSGSDVLALIRLANGYTGGTKVYSDFFLTLTTNAGTYALKFPNITEGNFVIKYKPFILSKELMENLEQEVKKNFIALKATNTPITAEEYETALLVALKKVKLDIELYKTDNNSGEFGKDWQQLVLKQDAGLKTANPVIKSNCALKKFSS